MNKTLFALFALSAALTAAPASAQMMCGAPQQAQASGQQSGGMMCGMTGQRAADDPMADKSEQKPQQQSGMCGCCRNMAMMGGGGMQHHNMPGMNMPKQQ